MYHDARSRERQTDGDVDTSNYGSNDDDYGVGVHKCVDGNRTRSNKDNTLVIYLLAAICR